MAADLKMFQRRQQIEILSPAIACLEHVASAVYTRERYQLMQVTADAHTHTHTRIV